MIGSTSLWHFTAASGSGAGKGTGVFFPGILDPKACETAITATQKILILCSSACFDPPLTQSLDLLLKEGFHRGMSAPPSVPEVLTRVLSCAATFRTQHRAEPGVGPTFGYFTNHPVAPLNARRLEALLTEVQNRASQLNRPLRILDLACGGGIITCALAEFGHRALGFDLSHDEIQLAKNFAQEQMLNGIFATADLHADQPWESLAEEILGGKPDVVTMAYALHHLPKVEIFLERLSLWLTSGTLLVINEENPDSPLFRLKHEVRTWIQKDTNIEWHRSYAAWRKMLESNHFKVSPTLQGRDVLPWLPRAKPELCWSLVFTAERT